MRFPAEIRSFFACGLPVGGKFFNWRDRSDANLQNFHSFYEDMKDAFLFDLENNGLQDLLGGKFTEITDTRLLVDAVWDYVQESPKLVPFYAHRCFFDGMDDMPIVSFWQPVDTIFYGGTFENYLEVEFLKKECILERVVERMENTGIWYELIG